MPGTLLLDDLHDSISQQLGDYASSLGSAVQGAQQAIAPVPLIPTPQAPDPNAILQELQQHAAAVAQAAQEQAQPAVQVLGQGVGGAVTQLGGAKDAVTQQLLQHAQDVASGAQDVNQQLQNHVQTVLGAATPTTPSEPGGVQSLVRPTPSPVLGAPSGDQNAPPVLGATTGAVNQPATAAATTAAPPDRTMSFQDYARAAAQRAGIDPNVFTAQIQQESGFNPSARSPAGAIGIAQFMPETAKGVNLDPTDPYASLDAAAAEDAKRLQQYGGDWGKTLASYNAGAGAVAQYGGIPPYAETQSYVKTIMGNAQKAADAAGTTISNAVQAGAQAVGGAASAVGTAAQQKLQDISQFGDKQLSADEAYAACGPAAAVRFAERFGRNPTLREATDLAKQVGWTSSGGMAGITSEQQLLKNMGVDTHIVAPDWLAIAKEAQTGNPVTISTPGHYYFADRYNPDTGAFHVGQSGLDLKNGAEWMTPQQMENLMGKAQGALFADNPNVPAKGASPTALGGAAGTQNAPITMGANQPARAPLVVEDQTPTPIRAAQDVLGAAGEAASQLGTTAQDLLAQAQELNRVQPGTEAIKAVTPILGGAAQAGGSAVSQVAQDVQQAAQGVLGAAQDVNRLTPGTTAVNAAAPVLGAAASDLGTGAQRAVQDLGDSGAANALLRQGRTPAEQAEFERQQGQVLGGIAAQANAPAPSLNAGDVARNAWDLVVNSSPGLPGVSLQDYQHASTVKNDWIEQNNPAKDVLLLGGLTTMIAQQVTDPYALTMFGFTGGGGRVAGEAAGEAATAATANRLGQQGAAFVGRVANKLVDGSIVGGVQNALYAAEQPNATPESVFTALWQGAALGSAAEGGTAALTPVARRIGQAIIDQAPRLRPAVAEFARSETGAAGRPSDVAAVRDEQAGRVAPVTPAAVETPRTPIGQGGLGTPRYEYPTGSTPQVISDTLRTAAERDSTGVAHVDSQSMGSLPSLPRQTLDNGKAAPAWQQGISPHLDDLRYAQDVGMNQSQWYSKFAQAVASVVGDQNVNEFRTLFGITSQQTPPTENLQYTLGLMRMAREFTANGTDFTPANIKQWIADNPRVTSTGTQGAKWKMNNDQFKKVAQLYTTGEVKVATNAKTSSYASNILSALMNRFDPNSTMDTWMAQIFNYKNPNRTASSDQAFQAMRTVVDHLAGETGQVPHQAQAAMWFAIKGAKDFAASRAASPTLKAMVKDFTNGRTTLRQVLDRAGSEGAYDNPTGTWEQVSKDLGVASELAKLQPHLDSGAPRPAIADSSYLYYPGKGTKLSGAEKIAGSAPRVSGVVPETTAYRAAAAERQAAVAETALPQTVRDTLRYDAETRQFGELRGIPHEVQGDQILVPGGNMDTLRYVAARVHEAAGPEAAPATLYTYRPESPDVVGWQILDIPAGQKQQLLDDLRASGIGHQELNDGTIGVNALPVRSADHEDAIGDAVRRAGAQYAEIHGHVEEASPGQSAVALERYGTRYADGGGVPEPGRGVAGSAGFRATEPIGRFFTPTTASAREGAASAGGGLRGPVEPGGFRAPVTPDDLNVRTISQQEARQLVGPAYDPSTRTTQRPPGEGEPGRPVPQATRVTQVPTVDELAARLETQDGRPGVSIEPYHAGTLGNQPNFGKNVVYRDADGKVQGVLQMLLDENGQPDSLSVAVNPARQRQGIATALYDAAKAAGYDVEKASGQSGYTEEGAALARSRQPAAAPGPVGREPPATPAGTRIEDIRSNPHLLREPGPGETPMTMDERLAHQDMLEQRYQANQDRLAAIDEQLRNPNQKPERPPWGAGWTNDQLVTLAKRQGLSAYEPLWWEKAGLLSGSGEVREDVGQSGLARGMGRGGAEPSAQDLRAERNTLALDQRDLEAAGEQQATAPDNARFVRRQQAAAADLPFAGGEENAPHGPYATEQPSSGAGSLAEDIVTQNGRKSYADPLSGDGLREAPGEVVGTRSGVTGTGISDIEAEGARPGAPSEATSRRMPNLDALLKGDMPEVRAQIQRAAEDNQALFDAYTQGRISHDSLVTDLATKVGMTRDQWLKTPVGKGFSTEEMVALQAAAIDAQSRSSQMAKDIVARGGVDALSPEQVAYGLNELVNNTRLLAVARGGRTSAGRTLNALKIRLDATMARGINASNERIGAQRLADQARTAVKRATQQLEQSKELNAEQRTAVTRARAQGAPRTIIDQIAEAYDQLDRYQAMTLHEKADDFNALKAAREAAAAKRQAAVREPPQELLSALQAELKAERDNFAKRKDTWETMAFWDSKANENVATKRNAFRGGLYIEQYRKAADLASKSAEADAKRAFDLESRRQTLQTQKATTLLEAVGGAKPSRELLAQYVEAVTSDDPLAAGKFVKGLMTPGWWARAQTLRIAGLLSSTVTHMANMVGNVTQVPLEVATHAAVVPIDWARAKATGGQRVAYMAELGPMLQGYGPGFASSMGDAVKILQTGISPADAVKLENIRPGIASGSGAVDAVLEGPLRALQAEDQLFKGGAFAMQANRVATRYAYREGFRGDQLAGRTANIIKNLEDYPELYSEAHAAMLRMVFQEHRDWIPAPRGAARGVVSQPLPFIKTPANITAQGMGLSPFGAAGAIQAVRARGALEATGKATGAQLDRATLLAEQRIARTAIGTAILGMGVGLGAGTFTGGKSMLTGAYDPNEASTYPQGWREWSVVTEDPVSGNTYYVPMQNFGAAGAPLAMAAILTDAGKRGNSLLDKDEAARAATSIGQYVLDNTFLQGLSDTVNVLHDPSRYANKFLESLVSSYGPFSAMGRQIQRAYGVASRNPHDGLMGLVEAMESNYPGLSGNVPESLTAIGEPRTQGISGGAAFALPVRADIMRDEPTLQALRANDVRIPPPVKAINVGRGWSIDLTPEEQDQVQRARGDIIRQQVAAVMDSPLYKNGDISVRNQLLSKAVSAASQNSDVLFSRSLSDADIKARAVRKTVPTPYTVAGESAA